MTTTAAQVFDRRCGCRYAAIPSSNSDTFASTTVTDAANLHLLLYVVEAPGTIIVSRAFQLRPDTGTLGYAESGTMIHTINMYTL
jgi:hypothetical protein